MNHLQPFRSRETFALPLVERNGWQLKRYATLAKGREFGEEVAAAATTEAIKRLPTAGRIDSESTNHGVGFQIIHFAETAVVSPLYYWQWGSVLAHSAQIRATWEHPTVFANGVKEVIGCVWELEVIFFEVEAWKNTVLSDVGSPTEKCANYLEQHYN